MNNKDALLKLNNIMKEPCSKCKSSEKYRCCDKMFCEIVSHSKAGEIWKRNLILVMKLG